MHKQCSRKHAPPASDNYFLFSWHWPLPFVLVVWITSSVLWKSSPSFHHRECGPTVRSERDYYDVLMWSCKYLALPIAFILPFCYKARALIIRGFNLPLYSSLSYYLVLGMYAQTAVKMSISTGRRREMVWPGVGSWWWVELTTSLYQHPHSGVFCDDLTGETRTNIFLPEAETQQQTKERILSKSILVTQWALLEWLIEI